MSLSIVSESYFFWCCSWRIFEVFIPVYLQNRKMMMKTGKALRNRWLTRQGSEFQGRLSTASLDVDTSHHLHFIHPSSFTLYTPPSSQLNTADANQLHAFRDLRSSLVVSSFHILNLPLFLAQQAASSQTCQQQPSAECYGGEHVSWVSPTFFPSYSSVLCSQS